jgi:regulator of protease activity HflC (stomatin/prohibitin superfamily)
LLKAILARINSIVPGELNAGLAASSGIEVLDGFISRFEPNAETKQFLEAQEEARLTGQAGIETATQKVLQAEQEAKTLQIQAAANLKAAQTEAAGQNAVFDALLETIMQKNPQVDFNTALQMATQLAIATKMSGKDSPVTVLGAGINIGVNTPLRKD